MKKFRRSRDDGTFALTTLQNPSLEVRNLCQLIAAAEKIVAEDACPPRQAAALDAPSSNDAPPPEAARLSPEDSPMDAPRIQTPPPIQELLEAQAPETSVDPAEPPAPPPRTRQPTTRRKPTPSSRKKAASPKPRRRAPRAPRREITALERHQRKCMVCNHPYRDTIDDHFLHWYPVGRIASDYGIPELRYIYRHARATGLLARRRLSIRDSLEYIVERGYDVMPSADAVIRAVRACSRINDSGEWVDPPARVSHSSDVQRHTSSDVRAKLLLPDDLPRLPAAIDVERAISNRHTPRLQSGVSSSKQTAAVRANRLFFAVVKRKIRAFLDA
ncbi:MAG: hypothetical protein WA211_01260 [Candidatus Acidiferrales bacterium]